VRSEFSTSNANRPSAEGPATVDPESGVGDDDRELPSWMRYQVPVRVEHFVSQNIDWDRVHAITRLQPTVTTFG